MAMISRSVSGWLLSSSNNLYQSVVGRGGRKEGDEEVDESSGKDGVRKVIDSNFLRALAAPFSAGLYAFMAISMAFFNKAVLTVHKYNYPNFLLLMQMLITIIVMYTLKLTRLVHLDPFTIQRAKLLAPVAILYNANVAFALASLASLNIPMYNVLKRLTPCVVLAMGVMIDKKYPSRNVSLSVLVTVLGCIVAGLGDLAFDLKGYCFAAMSCLLQSTYLLSVQKTGVEKGISSSNLLVYNALLSVPPLFLIAFLTGELKTATDALKVPRDAGFQVSLFMTVAGGMLLNYALFLCTVLNSALTTTIVGVMKGVVATILGFFFFGGVPASFVNIAGVVLNSIGGVWYTYLKYTEKQSKKEAQPPPEEEKAPLLTSDSVGASNPLVHEGDEGDKAGVNSKDTLV